MGRRILAVVIGYVGMAAFVFISFTVAYIAMGTDGAFEPGTYEVTMFWALVTIALSIVAAVLGGLVCAMIAKEQQAVKILAGIVLILGLVMAIPVAMGSGEETPKIRLDEVSSMEAMQVAQQPVWLAFLNPIIGAVGVLIGGRFKK